MLEINRIDRSRGCLLGLAIGDALGAPVEGLSFQQIRSHYTHLNDYVDGSVAWKKKPHRWRFPGLYSDDTQQALVLAEVLLECGRIVPERAVELYLELATLDGHFLGAHRGAGKSFRQAIERWQAGAGAMEAGQLSAGIGAAVRIAPLAIYFGQDGPGLFDAVMAASLMTHRDQRSLSGAFAVAHLVRRLLDGEPRSASLALRLAGDVARAEARIADEFADRALTGLPDHRHALSQAIARVEALIDVPRPRALSALVDEANLHGAEPECRKPTMGFPPACIPTCLYVLLTTDSLHDALVDIINLGGDTDSAGAIVGAAAGAHYGVNAIPPRWLAGLQNVPGVNGRAVALARQSPAGVEFPALVETERELSRREAQRRESLLVLQRSEGDLGANRRL
jgi:ADP-ribosylglycohydrolase